MRNIFLKNYEQGIVNALAPDPYVRNRIELISGSASEM